MHGIENVRIPAGFARRGDNLVGVVEEQRTFVGRDAECGVDGGKEPHCGLRVANAGRVPDVAEVAAEAELAPDLRVVRERMSAARLVPAPNSSVVELEGQPLEFTIRPGETNALESPSMRPGSSRRAPSILPAAARACPRPRTPPPITATICRKP